MTVPEKDVLQFAMFMQARDAAEYGVARDGVTHPTWEEASAIGQDDYLKQATVMLEAVTLLGWAPALSPTDHQAFAEAQIVDWFHSHSSAAVARVVQAGSTVLEGRLMDGVFE